MANLLISNTKAKLIASNLHIKTKSLAYTHTHCLYENTFRRPKLRSITNNIFSNLSTHVYINTQYMHRNKQSITKLDRHRPSTASKTTTI